VLVNLACASFPLARLWKRAASITAVKLVPTVTLMAQGAVIKVVVVVKA
jgi:hypothetical protein